MDSGSARSSDERLAYSRVSVYAPSRSSGETIQEADATVVDDMRHDRSGGDDVTTQGALSLGQATPPRDIEYSNIPNGLSSHPMQPLLSDGKAQGHDKQVSLCKDVEGGRRSKWRDFTRRSRHLFEIFFNQGWLWLGIQPNRTCCSWLIKH